MPQKLNLIPIEDEPKKLDLIPIEDNIDDILKKAKKSLTVNPSIQRTDITEVPRDQASGDILEPTTFWGGFRKSLRDQFLPTSADVISKGSLRGESKLETAGNIGNLLIPSNVPNISKIIPGLRKGKINDIGNKIIETPTKEHINPDTGEILSAPVDSKPIQFNRKGKTGETGSVQSKVETPSVSSEPVKPPTIKLKKPTPENVKIAKENGYSFSHVNEDGSFELKLDPTPTNAPILESEVGGHRPNKLGPVIDDKKTSAIAEAVNFPRAVMASTDMSAPLRQGLGLVHKKEFWTSLDDMFRAWGSEDAFKAVQQSIAEKPLFRQRPAPGGKILPSFAEDAGLKLTDLNDLSTREEALMSSWAEKVPGVRRSNRAYTAFINKLRADTFESLITDAKVLIDPEKNAPLAKEIANFVNVATGRGKLPGQLEKSAVALNSTFFAPRLIASRLTMLNPHYYITANPYVRKEALKSLLAIAALGNTVTQLGKLAGGKVETDPASADFGKLQIGNARLDPYGGFQQYIVAAQRLMPHIPGTDIGGRMKSTTTQREYDLSNPKYGESSRMDVAERFVRGKLNPALGFTWSLLDNQRELSGKKMNLTTFNPMENAVAQRFIPIMLQDLYSLGVNEPKNLPLAIPAWFGMGVQQYDGRQ